MSPHEAGVLAGYLLVTIGVPAAGLTCLVIGLVQRSRNRARTGPYPRPYQASPGFPVNAGYPPGPPAPYPPPRAGKSATALITIGAVLLALGGLGILGNAARVARHQGHQSHPAGQSPPSTGAAGPEIGRCFTEFELQLGSLDGKPDDCADPGATYELAAKGGHSATCPDGKRDGSIYSRLINASSTLCFAPNLKQGQCYLRTDQNTTTTWTPIDCAEARFAKFSVDKRIDGSTDETLCPPGTTANAFPTPPRVYCLAKQG